MIVLTDSEGPDLTARIRRLIRTFADRIRPKTRSLMARSIYGLLAARKYLRTRMIYYRQRQKRMYLRACAKCTDSDSSDACANSHPDICSRLIHSVMSNDSISRQRRSDQTARMRRLIRALADMICQKTRFHMAWHIYCYLLQGNISTPESFVFSLRLPSCSTKPYGICPEDNRNTTAYGWLPGRISRKQTRMFVAVIHKQKVHIVSNGVLHRIIKTKQQATLLQPLISRLPIILAAGKIIILWLRPKGEGLNGRKLRCLSVKMAQSSQ